MRPQASVFIATSLDGFIARLDGGLDWLDEANATVPAGEDCGYQGFMESIDVLIMGRKTYEKVLSFGEWPYGATPVVVLSRSQLEIRADLPPIVTCSSESPANLLHRLAVGGAKRVYIDGGGTIRSFLAAGLIDDLTITVIPTLLGEGLPLFEAPGTELGLKHIQTITYEFGFVQSTYSVRHDSHSADPR